MSRPVPTPRRGSAVAARPVPAAVHPPRSTWPQPKAMQPSSCQHPAGDAIRPQQADTGQRDADYKQPAADPGRQQKAHRVRRRSAHLGRHRAAATRPAPRQWCVRRSSRHRPWPRSVRAQRCHAVPSASALRSTGRDPARVANTPRAAPSARASTSCRATLCRPAATSAPSRARAATARNDSATGPSTSVGGGAERRDRMRADAQFADENVQRGLQRCGFGGATSGPEIPPPARPQRDTDDRGRRDNTDRQRDDQCAQRRRTRTAATATVRRGCARTPSASSRLRDRQLGTISSATTSASARHSLQSPAA